MGPSDVRAGRSQQPAGKQVAPVAQQAPPTAHPAPAAANAASAAATAVPAASATPAPEEPSVLGEGVLTAVDDLVSDEQTQKLVEALAGKVKEEMKEDKDAQKDQDGLTAPPAAKAAPAAPNAAPAPASAAPATNPAPAAEVPDVLGKDLLAEVDRKVPDVEKLVEKLRLDKDKLKVDKLATEALDGAEDFMGLLDKAVAAYQAAKAKWKGKATGTPPPPDVQKLQVRDLHGAQRILIQYSALGQVLLRGAEAAASSVPFAAPVGALLGAVYGKAVQCAKNRGNCSKLLQQIKRCDTLLAGLELGWRRKLQGQTTTSSSSSSSLTDGVLEGVNSLTVVIKKSAAAIAQYSDSHCIMRFITSGSIEQQFQQLDKDLCGAMGRISFEVSMETLAKGSFKDEAAELRAAVCQAVGLPESKAKEALEQLAQQAPDQLRVLLEQHGSFSDQVIALEIKALEGRVTKLEKTAAEHANSILQLQAQRAWSMARGLLGMARRIGEWWDRHVSKDQQRVHWSNFKQSLLDSGLRATVDDYGRRLGEEVQGWTLPTGSSPREAFLDQVLLRLLDTDGDQHISMSELKVLQLMAASYEADKELDMSDLLECVYACCDRTALQLRLSKPSSLASVTDKLKATSIISTYKTVRLLEEYLPGTRTWMCEKVGDWLAAAAQPQQDHAAAAQPQEDSSRMFLLLAEAGMGKSVCSAVLLTHLAASKAKQRQLVVAHHFFKVGQQRGEGKAMIRCLAQQLCYSVPGLADLVEQQIQDLPDLASLSMAELFDKVLLTPLKQLDEQLKQKPSCLLVLDALDESTDNTQGWQPVCNLVATQFQRLPSWVCVLVTGRPSMESCFNNWKPAKWIAATDQHNQSDLHTVLLAKLKHSGLVDHSLVDEAADLLLKKSQGQFIYAKYVFIRLAQRAHWSREVLQQLPDGLQQMYCYQLDTILAALQAERRELVPLFTERLLPMLAVMQEALPAHLLAWLVQGRQEKQVQQEDVALLLRLLYSLFPSKDAQGGATLVAPYHKSIQDFLLQESDQGTAFAGQLKWQTPAAEAHKLFVSRLLPELQKPQLTHWKDDCKIQVLPELTAGQQYCLQYTVDHIALAKDWAALHQLLRHLPGLKAVLEVPGQVHKLTKVLAEAAGSCPAGEHEVFLSVQRFLEATSSLISQDPHSILQEMANSPGNCVLGDWCEQDYQVQHAIGGLHHQASTGFWSGAQLLPTRAASIPPEVDQLAAEALAEAPHIMDLLDEATSAYQAAKAEGKPPPAVQQLQLGLNPAQQALLKYSALGQVVVDAAAAAESSLPFGAPVAALLGAVYSKAVQSGMHSHNCNLLLQQIKRCDKLLAHVVASSKRAGQSSLPEGVLQGLKSLTEVIQESAVAIARYSERSVVMRFITSNSDKELFERLEQRLHKAMQQISFDMAMEALVRSPFTDESAELRAAACQATGLPASQAEQALERLRK